MDLIAYMQIFRRRWIFLAVPMLVAVGVAWWTLPEQQPATGLSASATSYTATSTLIATPDLGVSTGLPGDSGSSINLNVVELYTTLGEVPKQAAQTLGYTGDPQVLASRITVTLTPEVGTLQISATDDDPDNAVAIVRAFSGAVMDFFSKNKDEAVRQRIAELQRQTDKTVKKLREVQAQQSLNVTPDPILSAQLSSFQATYSDEFSQMRALKAQLGGQGPLSYLQEPSAIPQESAGAFKAPSNRWVRLALAALLGLLLGAALALMVERIDSRIRSREQAEESFGLPVLAEVPPQPWSQRKSREIVSYTKPASASAEAYRTLRSSILLLGPASGTYLGSGAQGSDPTVIMVTSASPQEGKTTTVANLAAVMAEAGRSVLVLSLDLRNPRLHEFFGVDNGTGISELLAADRGQHLEQVVQETDVPGIGIATSGRELTHPGALLAAARPLIDKARQLADVVIVDTAPMLTVSDAVDLATMVDLAIVVARMNSTTTGEAASMQRLLSRLNVPALGSLLIGSSTSTSEYHMSVPAHVLDRDPTDDVRSPDATRGGDSPGMTRRG